MGLPEIFRWLSPSEIRKKIVEGYRTQEEISERMLLSKETDPNRLLEEGDIEKSLSFVYSTPIRMLGVAAYCFRHPFKSMRLGDKLKTGSYYGGPF